LTRKPNMPNASGAAPDVFLSYAREDRATAQALAEALQAQGLRVWWDQEIPVGHDFTKAIADKLASARMTCVLWSQASVVSAFVRDECTRARDAGKLLPIRIDEVDIPLGFGTLQTLDLLHWNGQLDAGSFPTVRDEILRAVHNSHLWKPRPSSRRGQGATGSGSRWPAGSQTFTTRKHSPWIIVAAVAALVVTGVWGGHELYQRHEANRFLDEGLRFQFAREPQLDAARESYLQALRARPQLGLAHYYLAHVQAQSGHGEAAREAFLAALQDRNALDTEQRRTAERLLGTLDQGEAEPAPLARTASRPAAGASAPGHTASASSTEPAPVQAELPLFPPEVLWADKGGSLSLAAHAVPAAPDQQREARAQAEALFNPDPQPRLEAASALAITPGLVSDALPIALQQSAQRLAQAGVPTEATRQGLQATLALANAASPMTLSQNRTSVAELLVLARRPVWGHQIQNQAAALSQRLQAITGTPRPVAYVQIAHERQRAIAQAISQALTDTGYLVPPIELVNTTRSPSQTEIRTQGNSHIGLGRWLRRVAAQSTRDETVRLTTLRRAHPDGDTYELWLSRDLCTPGHDVPGCGP
jgi:tetratricopeptide (TPR) repeat protein